MSSCPGYTLELFLAWEFNLTVEDQAEANTSLAIAETFSSCPNRRCLTQEQFKAIVGLYEESRSVIEDALFDFDEDDHGSWRNYGCYVLSRYYSPEAEQLLHDKVLAYLAAL